MTLKRVRLSPSLTGSTLLSLLALIGSGLSHEVDNSTEDFFNLMNGNSNAVQFSNVLPILYDTSGIDGELQKELAQGVLVALRVLEKYGELIRPLFMDLSKLGQSPRAEAMEKCAKMFVANQLKVGVSLLESDDLAKFALAYSNKVENGDASRSEKEKLHIFTPRPHRSQWKAPEGVAIKCLQMSEESRAVALLNRVGRVGVRTLIPILDGDSSSQMEMLEVYSELGKKGKYGIKLTKPIFLSDPVHSNNLRKILQEYSGFHEQHLTIPDLTNDTDLKPGVLLLAKKGSRLAMKIASEKNHLLFSWFSPDIIDFEEWVYGQSSGMTRDEDAVQAKSASQKDNGAVGRSSLFGLYTVNFVGSKGWDNPLRRRVLRELTTFAGTTPRILTSVLTYDATWLARDFMKQEVRLPKAGLSGLIDFNDSGFRRSGTYLGTSSVSSLTASTVTLLQPSMWILEDIATVTEVKGSSATVTDYDVATSAILQNRELMTIANSTRTEKGCKEHLMSVVTYDPFNQMPYHYFFSEKNLPETIVVPNGQGFGITFVCTHLQDESSGGSDNGSKVGKPDEDVLYSTLELACTPGQRLTHPINCFRSKVHQRVRRDAGSEQGNLVPNVQYQYSLTNNDPWTPHNVNQWANRKEDTPNQYYYQASNRDDYQVPAVTFGYQTTRLDVPISEEPVTPAPAPQTSKLPELRQILKAAKPFVGSCIGSSTGCAMCVLVLGRLPLGALPAACTGPCFVGTFGSCGSLLGRVFSETTVICTELFRQGFLDSETFMADAEFGKFMAESSPYTMEGYTLLATPLVEVMKSSQLVTRVVATFALPWAHHMKYLLGRTNDTSLTGSFIHTVGYPLCNMVGRSYSIYLSVKNYFVTNSLLFLSPIISFLITIAMITILIPNLGFSTATQRYNIFQAAIIMYIITSKSRNILQTGLDYFKAIGKRT